MVLPQFYIVTGIAHACSNPYDLNVLSNMSAVHLETRKMKTILTLVAVALLSAATPSFAADPQAELIQQAETAAKAWMALTDAGKYGESWERAGTFFKTGIAKNTWETGVRSLRAPLGPVKTRELKSTEYATTLPGAPDGEYVVIQYETQFENKKSAAETVTPMREKDGSWKVSGYFIR